MRHFGRGQPINSPHTKTQEKINFKNLFMNGGTFSRDMNTTIMLTYYYDEPSDNDTSSLVTNTSERVGEAGAGHQVVSTTSGAGASSHSLAMRDHAANPALVHHLYLGLGHMGKVSREKTTTKKTQKKSI